MKNNPWRIMAGAVLVLIATQAGAVAPVTRLVTQIRGGQIFLTWDEGETPKGTSFNVYISGTPVTDVKAARLAGHHIEQHSARDWWEDPASFKKGATPGKPVGFRITDGGDLLNAAQGLFVHTVGKDEAGQLYFAVTCRDAEGREDAEVEAGKNATATSVEAKAGAILPIWLGKRAQPAAGAGKGKPLWLNLHAKGGVVPDMEYLVFGDGSMGWREGLAFKYSVRIENDTVLVQPTDRVWINRPHKEANDGGMPAIWTFWYGYNSHIYDRKEMETGVPVNYTERRNLWLLNWVDQVYQPDRNRWYCSGGSMGGCGTMSFGLRHPELFAACHARVPIVSYTYAGTAHSAVRLEPSCWTGPIPPDLKDVDGVPLLERMNGTKFVAESQADLPYVFMINGRSDGSIPWVNNPPFYQAMESSHQGFSSYWDDGTHSTCGKSAPDDIAAWIERFRRFRRDESYPAFTHTSTDRNPGHGDPKEGDIIGWMNRGMDWKDIEDTPDHYAITLTADYPGIEYPVTTDVTLRRVQRFALKPGETVRVSNGGGSPAEVAADASGHVTLPKLSIPSKNGLRVTLQRGNL